MAAQAWRVLELTPDLRHAVEAAAKAAGLGPEAWLARAIRKAALQPGTLPEPPSTMGSAATAGPDPGARSLSALLEQAFDTGRSRVAETKPYTEPPPPVPEPPSLVSGTAGDTYIARLPALYMPPPPPRRRTLALIMLIALVVSGGTGAGFFYLRYGDLTSAVAPALIAALPPAATAASSKPASRTVAEVPPPIDTATAPPEAPASASVEDFALGIRYAFGNGVPQDYGKAAEFFQKAASQGLPDAQYNLGALYERGLGVPKDPVRAVAWYRFAAKQSHAAAELSLGLAYANGDGVAQDYGEAARWFRAAAGQGVVTAQYNLGALYADGRGVTRSAIEAYALFSMAADAGDSDARHQMLRLAQQMTPKDLRAARTRSAELAQAMVHLEGADGSDNAAKAPPAKP
jgi:TPR repeat protein